MGKKEIERLKEELHPKILRRRSSELIIGVGSPERDLNVWAHADGTNFDGIFLYYKDGKGYWRITLPAKTSDLEIYATLNVNDYSEEEKRWGRKVKKPSKFASIVIPSHNRAKSLDYLLKSLVLQSYPKDLYEIIVSDYGSTDETKEVVQRYEGYSNLKYIFSPFCNMNPSRARNAGISLAKGEIIVCLDADMVADPSLIWEHMKYHHWSENLAIIGRRIFIDPSKLDKDTIAFKPQDLVLLRCKSQRTGDLSDPKEKRYKVTDMFKKEGMPWLHFSTCNVSFRRVDALNAELFNEFFDGWGYEDNEFAYRLFYHRRGIYIVPALEAVAYHQEHARDISALQRSEEENENILIATIKNFKRRR